MPFRGIDAECGAPDDHEDEPSHHRQAQVDDQLCGERPCESHRGRGQAPQDALLAIAGKRAGQASTGESANHEGNEDRNVNLQGAEGAE
jgi:hypothetical protein